MIFKFNLSVSALAFLLFFLNLESSIAGPIQSVYDFPTYQDAENGKDFIRLEMGSTHFGFIENHFTGFVKNFIFSGDLTDQGISNSNITFPVLSVDTDFGVRDNLIHNDAFDSEHFPKIVVTLSKSVDTANPEVQVIPSFILVKGQNKNIIIHVKVKEGKKNFKIEGSTMTTLTELGITNLSVPTVSIHDDVTIRFKIHIGK